MPIAHITKKENDHSGAVLPYFPVKENTAINKIKPIPMIRSRITQRCIRLKREITVTSGCSSIFVLLR